MHVSRGVATHGFAVNVDVDLDPFDWVVACGLPDVRMTSLLAELGEHAPGVRCFRREMAYRFCRAHGRRQRLVSPARLGLAATPTVGGAPTGAEDSSKSIPVPDAVPA